MRRVDGWSWKESCPPACRAETVVGGAKRAAFELQQHQYVKLIDQGTGVVRVERGEKVVFPRAHEEPVDGGAHWGRMDQLWLPTPLGGTRRAVAADVTHIRWSLPQAVPPGHAGRLSYRATMR